MVVVIVVVERHGGGGECIGEGVGRCNEGTCVNECVCVCVCVGKGGGGGGGGGFVYVALSVEGAMRRMFGKASCAMNFALAEALKAAD